MSEKHLDIVEHAFKLFIHYGVSKTSMTEISVATKVARQTLYKRFNSKEDLIFAALLHYSGQTRDEIENACVMTPDLPSRLDVVFEHMGLIPFRAMQTYPHLDEVLEIGDNLAAGRKVRIRANYTDAIGLVLLPWKEDLARNRVDLPALCELIKSMFTQIKRDARDENHLRSLFCPLRAMVVNSAMRDDGAGYRGRAESSPGEMAMSADSIGDDGGRRQGWARLSVQGI